MGAYGILRRILRVVGSPWGFFPVAIVAFYAYGVGGRPFDALPLVFEWALVVGACHWLSRLLPERRAPSLPTNRPMPPPMLAVSITPVAPGEGSPDLGTMKTRLSAEVARLLR